MSSVSQKELHQHHNVNCFALIRDPISIISLRQRNDHPMALTGDQFYCDVYCRDVDSPASAHCLTPYQLPMTRIPPPRYNRNRMQKQCAMDHSHVDGRLAGWVKGGDPAIKTPSIRHRAAGQAGRPLRPAPALLRPPSRR